MNLMDPRLARHEIDRRLRDADHYRRIRWARRTRGARGEAAARRHA
jgi:hypothetical protein